MRILRTAVALLAALSAFVPAPRAQEVPPDSAPGHLAFVEGSATLTRDSERDSAVSGTPLLPGDVVRTDRGRANLLFPDGSSLDLDEYSTLEMLSPTLFRLSEGRLILSVTGANDPATAVRFVIDTSAASAETYGPGEYRVSILGSPTGLQSELAVVRGSAALANERGATPLRAAQRSLASDEQAPSSPQSFNAARQDAFVRWSASLRDERAGSVSASYLPSELRPYGGALDRNGAWQYDSNYGYVWYPTVVSDWRPYDDGYWSAVPRYGWTWIGVGAWSWPTHHYGRWGHTRSRWFWIPDRRWAPAWVSWGAAPGYVSWCPLGFDNRPVFSWGMSSGDRRGHSGWTILARDRFGARGRNIRHDVISPRALASNIPFVTQTSAPPAPWRAIRRGIPGISPGGKNNASSTQGFSPGDRATRERPAGGRERWRPAPPTSASEGPPNRPETGATPRGGRSTPSPRGSGVYYSRPEPLPPGQTPPQDGRPTDPAGRRTPARSRNPMVYSAPPQPQGRSPIYSMPAPVESQGRDTPPTRRAGREFEARRTPPGASDEPSRSRRETSARRAEAQAPAPAPRASESPASGQDRSSGGRAVPRGRDHGGSASAPASRPSGSDGSGRAHAARRPR